MAEKLILSTLFSICQWASGFWSTIDYYLSLPYRLEIIPDTEEGGFTASYPDLPGCLTCADSMEGIVANVADAKRAWPEAALEDGVEIAEPSIDEDLSGFSGQFKLRMPKSYTALFLFMLSGKASA